VAMLLVVFHLLLFVVCFDKVYAQCTSSDYFTCVSNNSCIFVDGKCYTNDCSNRTCGPTCFNGDGVCHFDECVLFSDNISCNESGYGCSTKNRQCSTIGQIFVLVMTTGTDSSKCGHSPACLTVEYALSQGGGSSVFMRKKLYFGMGIFQFRPKNYTYTQSGFGDNNFNAFIGNAPVSSSNATKLLMQMNGSLQYSYSYFFNFDNVEEISLYFVNLILSFEMFGTTISSFNGTFIRLGTVGSRVIIDSCTLQQEKNNSEKLSMTLFLINNGSILITKSTFQDFSFVSTYNSAIFGLEILL
jgi:hypothetical protein